MRNYIQAAKTVTIPAPATVASGEVVIAGSLVGIAAGDAASGALVDVSLEGVFSLPKVSADVVTVGLPLYYDAGTDLVTIDDDEGGNPRLGTAVAAAGAGVGSVKVRLVQLERNRALLGRLSATRAPSVSCAADGAQPSCRLIDFHWWE